MLSGPGALALREMRADQVLQLLEHEGSSEEDVRQLLRRGGHIFNGILDVCVNLTRLSCGFIFRS